MDLIERLGLQPHPEGGYFRRIHTAAATVATPQGERAAASAIHYLLTTDAPQARLHRVRSSILHFLQSGGPVRYLCIDRHGERLETVLGFGPGQALFLEVPGGTWKASRLEPGSNHALVSEVVVPGFDWADHEYLSPEALPPPVREHLQAAGWL